MSFDDHSQLLGLIIGVWAGLVFTTGWQMLQIGRLENRIDHLESLLDVHHPAKQRKRRRPRRRQSPAKHATTATALAEGAPDA